MEVTALISFRQLALEQRWTELYEEVKQMKVRIFISISKSSISRAILDQAACGSAHMKSILAIGELGSMTNVYKVYWHQPNLFDSYGRRHHLSNWKTWLNDHCQHSSWHLENLHQKYSHEQQVGQQTIQRRLWCAWWLEATSSRQALERRESMPFFQLG